MKKCKFMLYASSGIAYVAKFRNRRWNEQVARMGKLRTHIEFYWKCLPDKVHLEDGKGDGTISLYSYVSYGDGFRGSGLSKNSREFDCSLKASFGVNSDEIWVLLPQCDSVAIGISWFPAS
jgi:hypothetical protein